MENYNLVYKRILNQGYRGHAEQCSYTFTVNKPDQLGAYWTAKEHLDAHIQELQEEGSIILEYYLWEDRTPTWETNYYCRIVASASPALPWGLIILAVLRIIIPLLIFVWIINEVKEIVEYAGTGGPVGAISWVAVATIAVATVLGIYMVKKKG